MRLLLQGLKWEEPTGRVHGGVAAGPSSRCESTLEASGGFPLLSGALRQLAADAGGVNRLSGELRTWFLEA